MTILTSTEDKVSRILVAFASQGKTVTFTEIMQNAGIGRGGIGKCLSHIGTKCKELGLPAITSIVVYKGTKKVGSGYAEFDPDFESHPKEVEKEQKRVFGEQFWDPLFL